MSYPTPCRYLSQPGGCRKRDCTFSHSAPVNRPRPHPSANTAGSPPDSRSVCRFYWSSKNCRDGANCRFSHIENPSLSASSSAPNSILPFLTDEGLAKVTGIGTDALSPQPPILLAPSKVRYILQRFLSDEFRFRTTSEIYAFLSPFSSATSANPAWSLEDGQVLLTEIAKGNGLLRFSDVIRWPSVSSIAGSDPTILSFQRAWLPLMQFYSSDTVVKSTLHRYVNSLYTIIMNEFETFSSTLITCMDEMISRQSFRYYQGPTTKGLLGSQILACVTGVLFECLTRFKNATATHPQLTPTVQKLQSWLDAWVQGIKAEPPKFDDVFVGNIVARDHIINHLSSKMQSIVAIVDRERARIERQQKTDNQARPTLGASNPSHEGCVAMLEMTFEGPGGYSETGPRHDNDPVDIQNIRIAPTNMELICRKEPFLPANFYAAPHHLPADSMERLLDVQFRLLREELTAPLRTSIQCVRNDLLKTSPKTRLAAILARKGGKYRGTVEADESIMFNLYTGIKFHSITPDHRGLSVNISLDTPPGRARQSAGRARGAFWESMSGKRLMQGGLIALVWAHGQTNVDVHLGIIASPTRELADSARQNSDRISARIVFFDREVEIRILDALKHPYKISDNEILLVESPVMYEAIRPFLEALTIVPEMIPFHEILVHHPPEFFRSYKVKPPAYAAMRHFKYRLGCLFEPGAWDGVTELTMAATDPDSVENARSELKRASRLDSSQVDAVVDSLTREVSLIQGPPGTGKSFTGVELLRVLVQHTSPILVIAFTNHALDHLLTSVLDASITNKIVRLGSRSTDERISQFSIENLEFASTKRHRLPKSSGAKWKLKSVQEKVTALMNKITPEKISSSDITEYIQTEYPEHYEGTIHPPSWIGALIENWGDPEGEGGWKTVGKHGSIAEVDDSPYARWLRGNDLDFLRSAPNLAAEKATSLEDPQMTKLTNRFTALDHDTDAETSSSGSSHDEETDDTSSETDLEDEADWQRVEYIQETTKGAPPSSLARESYPTLPLSSSNMLNPPRIVEDPQDVPTESLGLSDLRDPIAFFAAHSISGIPEIPTTNRALEDLLQEGQMWSLSRRERQKLDQYWQDCTREQMYRDHLLEFQDLREKHEHALKLFEEEKNEIRRDLLRNVDIIACTTTGAAKFASLLKGIEPKMLLVEEAGQVMEAHILGTLVPSIQHLILIGDPLQLRPTLNNYKLSMDSHQGSRLYRFDMSLMERLSKSGFPMSRIDIQRRMRPEVSDLVRITLYPTLEDHNLVKEHPDVRGFTRNVFFLTHSHRENDGNEEDASSKYNTYEVQMIKDMVLYLLRQGCYSQDGDIVVLCAYLGQLARVRDALAQHVAVIIDQRDQEALADQEAENEADEANIQYIQVSKRVRLRTVDNYQGEEANIVILSLVRNAGEFNDGSARLGSTIGFLRSKNRTNVALSRAKHGLFILGNASQLASKSTMWSIILEELQRKGSIGDAIPFSCYRHPDKVNYISKPGQLPLFSPDGGCLEPCDYRLKCGHVCPYKCHPDDTNHVAVVCSQPCRKLCPRNHPCSKQCSVDCGLCGYPVPHVELPCGHVIDSVPCYLMEDLEAVRCDVIVRKQLTSCEHVAELPCHTDVADYQCARLCDGIMDCCGRNCGSPCHKCQAENTMEGVEKVARVKHCSHACKKTLYCGHQCATFCSQPHKCTTMCREACRQECAHGSCRQYCSNPCVPCKEACTWTCSHHTCPLPCGSVCARLPCDRRCEKDLSCGHQCPSVCGEDCSIQVCPTCAPSEMKETVVDMILHLTMEDILLDEGTLDNMLITLPKCRHVFTVETLDGICSLGEYYTKNHNGSWSGLTSPHHVGEIRRPPACPTCRAAITSPRYGRVFKSANLDILERNVISHMSTRMGAVQSSLDAIDKSTIETKLVADAGGIKPNTAEISKKAEKARKKSRKAAIESSSQRPVSIENIRPQNNKLFNVAPRVSSSWSTITRDMLMVYKNAMAICDIRSAHIDAWEAAFSFLHEQEMNKAVSDPARAPRRLAEHAMRVARMNVGIPQPRADKRFLVEAIWVTIQIRFTLVDLAQVWINAVSNSTDYSSAERREWGVFGMFLLNGCERDIQIASEVAEASESRRQMTINRLLGLRVQLEKCRFNIDMTRQCGRWDSERRSQYAEQAGNEGRTASQIIIQTATAHRVALPGDHPDWIRDNFLEVARVIWEEWQKLERTLKADTFYEPVSLDEKTAVIKAFASELGHTGHYYTCQNGHVFVITECGGAMQASTCPECGQRIGGSNHQLDSSNRRADEFEQLAREVGGAQQSPWAWA